MDTELSPSNSSVAMKSQEIRSYAQLQEAVHRDLLAQNPEWIDSEGNCPTCDDYDRRFAVTEKLFCRVVAGADRSWRGLAALSQPMVPIGR